VEESGLNKEPLTKVHSAIVVDVVRTPFGKGRSNGILAGIHPVDLLATCLKELVERDNFDPSLIDDVIVGCSSQVGEQSGNIARHAVLAAGFPESVPGVTIDRKCGSFQQAFHFGAQGIIAGAYDAVVVAGVEMMGLIPMKINRLGRDELGPLFNLRYPSNLVPQGISAELIASKYELSRRQLDEFSLRSHLLARDAMQSSSKLDTLVPIVNDNILRSKDEGIRENPSMDALSQLKPAFYSQEMSNRFPQINWSVTAGNSSQISDGASAALLVSEKLGKSSDLRPKGVVRGFSVVGDDPITMLMGVVPATKRVLERSGLTLSDIKLFEVNEAFASVVLAFAKELNVSFESINVSGGAIAYGHPVGASGGRLFAQILDDLSLRGGGLGLVAMCESGGMANATIVEVDP
jgi:acetyl-CoA acyltransferase